MPDRDTTAQAQVEQVPVPQGETPQSPNSQGKSLQTDSGREKGRKRRTGRQTRERIIEVAENLIAQYGPDGFQLQNVTEILGITPPAIYNHFKDRDDLVAHIAEKGSRELTEGLQRHPGEDLITNLAENAKGYIQYLVEHPAHARIILWEMARRGVVDWQGLQANNVEVREKLRTVFEKAAKKGIIRPIKVEYYLQLIYIGGAAAAVYTDYASDAAVDGVAPPIREVPAEEVGRLKNEIERLVIRMLAPE